MFCVPLAWFVGVFVSFETEQFSSELVWVLALQLFFLLEIGNSSRDQELSQRHFWVIIINNEWMLFVFVWYLRQTRTIEWKRRWIFQRSSLLSKVFMKSAELSIAKKIVSKCPECHWSAPSDCFLSQFRKIIPNYGIFHIILVVPWIVNKNWRQCECTMDWNYQYTCYIGQPKNKVQSRNASIIASARCMA